MLCSIDDENYYFDNSQKNQKFTVRHSWFYEVNPSKSEAFLFYWEQSGMKENQ